MTDSEVMQQEIEILMSYSAEEYVSGLAAAYLAGCQKGKEAQPVQPNSEWRDIASAPIDGTFVDVWAAGERYADVCFTTSQKSPRVESWCTQEWDELFGWRTVGIVTPTHWMPIPAAPKETK